MSMKEVITETEVRQYVDFIDWYDAQLLNYFSNDFLRQFRDKIDWNFYIFNICKIYILK